MADDIDDQVEMESEHGVLYEGRRVRMFDRMIDISSSDNWTIPFRYPCTPSYFSSSSDRKASMVSGLYAHFQ